jgi:hypothetical protein
MKESIIIDIVRNIKTGKNNIINIIFNEECLIPINYMHAYITIITKIS